MITLIIPSRGRPEAADAAVRLAMRNSVLSDTRIVVAIDDDDSTRADYDQFIDLDRVSVVTGPRLRMGPTLNVTAIRVARDYPDSIVGFTGDDHRARTYGWDAKVANCRVQYGRGVYYGNDLVHGPNLPTAVFVTADLVNSLGYIAPPGLLHLYLDNFWLDLGREVGSLHYLPDVVIEHMHPIVSKAEWDDGYVEANSHDAHDHAEYDRYMAEDWPTEKLKLAR